MRIDLVNGAGQLPLFNPELEATLPKAAAGAGSEGWRLIPHPVCKCREPSQR